MEAYAVALTYATPGFLVLIIIEALAAWLMGRKINKGLDTISSLSSGMTNTLKSLIGLSIVILSYGWMEQHLALFDISAGWWVFLLAFIGHDFAGYWAHRFNHEINVFWNRHIVHHSSEEFNLACALRQSISSFVGVYFFLYIPMAIIGIPNTVVMVVAPIHLFAQFWYHTRLINRMGWLEYLIVTPSHHRVHHAINPIYIDKNYSEIFIIWDKLFGTFQEELPEEPPVYGVKKAVQTWNPVLINFMHIWGIAKDAWRTQKLWDKVRIWFMPTGWRPADVSEKFPVAVTTDVYAREKYDTKPTRLFLIWAWVQLLLTMVLLYYMLTQFAALPYMHVLLYAAFILISIFAFTTTMDRHPMAAVVEGVRCIFGLVLIYNFGGWFNLDQYLMGAGVLMSVFLVASFITTLWFSMDRSAASRVLQTS
ncbi:MAG: sterol desaturase family protein [Bacteroidota bacterium]